MWYKLSQTQSEKLNIDLPDYVNNILADIANVGGRALIVGGAVRDFLINPENKPKDIDFEVYRVSYEQLTQILQKYGKADLVGQSFGVIKFVGPDGSDFDFSLPRTDSKSGVGHKDFNVQVSSDLTPEQAAARRDFTFNCLAGNTKILTKNGLKPIKELVNEEHFILTTDGEWVNAPILSGGVQNLYKVTLQRNSQKEEIFCTPEHKWYVRNNHTGQYSSIIETKNLKNCHRIPSNYPKPKYNNILQNDGVCRGFVFGDGSTVKGHKTNKSVANFCGEKDTHLFSFFENSPTKCSIRHYKNVSKLNGLPLNWKHELPSLTDDLNYLFSWLSGYFAADGCVTPAGCPILTSIHLEHLTFIEKICNLIGIGTYKIRSYQSKTGYNPNQTFYSLPFVRDTLISAFFIIPHHKKRFEACSRKSRCNWRVCKVEKTDLFEEVFCAFVEETHTFTLEHNILTSNSISYDPLTGEIIDPYNGREDLKNKVMRHTSEAFSEDPLRVLRGMNFVGRYGFSIDPQTAQLAHSIRDQYQHLPKERVEGEFRKLVQKGVRPGDALQFLYDTGWSENFPHIHNLKGVPQDGEWHPEGWELTAIPFTKFRTGVAQAKPINLLTRQFILDSFADSTTIESDNITANTKFFVQTRNGRTNLFTTNATRISNFFLFPLINSPTSITPTKSLMNRSITVAQNTNKIIGIMFKIPASSVLAIMGSSVNDNQIIQGIIQPIAVNVVNMLTGKQISAQMQLHNISMQKHGATNAGDSNLSISSTVINPKFSVINNDIIFYFYLSSVGDVDIHDTHDTHECYLVNPGGVDIHTAHVMNAAADIATRENLSPEDREVLIYAALAHDFAKPATTKTMMKKGVPRITSHGHEEQGGPMARHFLESIGVNKKVIDKVVPLVERHLNHIHFSHSEKQDSFVKQLAEKLHPANIQELERLVEADHSGRPPLPKMMPEQQAQMSELARKNNVYTNKHPDLLQGKDVLQYTNGVGGPMVGQILKEHRDKILKHELLTREDALNWLLNRMKKQSALINGNDVTSLGINGPKVKQVLDNAWTAQTNGDFTDRDSALQWLNNQSVE